MLFLLLQHARAEPHPPQGAEEPPLWLELELAVAPVLTFISQTTIHSCSLAAMAWRDTETEEARAPLLHHYVICNDTHEALRFGQVRAVAFYEPE